MHNRFEDVYTNELRKLRGYITEHRAEISALEEAHDELAGIVARVLAMVEDTKDPANGDHLGNFHMSDIVSKALN